MKASQIESLRSVSRPTFDPNGARAVFAVSHPDLGADANVGQLFSVPLDGSEPARRITRGFRDSDPRFSPDGTRIAFVRSEQGAAPQLHVIPASGGEPVRITDAPIGVGSYRWSPDSSTIAFIARVPEQGRYGTVEGRDAAAEAPRRITTLRYKSNGLGYTNDRPAQVFVVEVPQADAEPIYTAAPSAEGAAPTTPFTPAARQLTFAATDHGPVSWAPDSRSLLLVAALHEGRDTDLRSALYLLDSREEGAKPRAVTAGNLGVAYGVFDPTGGIYFLAEDLGETGLDFVGAHTGLYRIDRLGQAARRLTDPRTVDLGDSTDISLLGDGSALVQLRDRGTVQLARVTPEATIQTLTDGAIEIVGHTSGPAGVVVALSTADSAGEIAVLEPSGPRFITAFGSAIREAGVLPLNDLVVTARDGSPVHGWVLLPEGEGPHPVLLVIHGGPYSQYTSTLFDEVQVYANAGYGVVFCNPRGSAGYGLDHGRAIRHQMGTVDYTDVMDFLDGAIASQPSLDGSRVGVMGGSYGGFLTAWIIGHTDRFAGAIVERGFLDPVSFAGTSDIGSFFGQAYMGDDPARVQAQSPQAFAHLVSTPTLVMHSADDLRCPLGQAEQYYASIKSRGIPSELVIFPGENHELSRSGRPRHRVERFDAILEWWSRYLPVTATPAGTPSPDTL